MTRVEWTYTVETSRLLRTLALVPFGAIAGLFVFFGAFSLFVFAGSLLSGNFGVLALLLAFGLLGARRMATHAALARSGNDGLREYFSARELAAASVAWAAVLGALVALDAPSECLFGVVAVAVLGTLPIGAALRSEGYVDTAEGVLRANNNETVLTAVDSVSRYDLGSVSVLRVHYPNSPGVSAPRLFGVPSADAARIREAIESSDAEPPTHDRNPTIARTLYAFAVGSVALAAAFAYFATTESGDTASIGVLLALFAGLFGVLFAWLGYVEG
ncbi:MULTISPECIES: hypothetical protein [Halobacterium]|uniref:hypothetical protein n=1 Tax=Halobacterium TaxID=2239 RepID=UPI00073F5F8D|nr:MULTISPECIES: hypothetical protein [Halobacterium]MCG1003663.1 hypothetical protein [Halobacterium noricense]